MRLPTALLLLATLASGCLSGSAGESDDRGSDPADGLGPDRDGYREGVVFFETDFTVTSLDPASFSVDVAQGALDVILEVQQDSGIMPNLEVRLSGCGQVQPAASAGWETYLLCQEPTPGRQSLRIAITGGAMATGSGRLLLRADLPSA